MSFQQATQHADDKARALATLYLAISAAAATQSEQVAGLHGIVAALVWSGGAAFVLAFLCAGYWLVQAIRPRTTRTPMSNRFSFPNVARGVRTTALSRQAEAFIEEARNWSVLLAQIAETKNRYVARSLAAVCVMFLTGLLYLIIVTGQA